MARISAMLFLFVCVLACSRASPVVVVKEAEASAKPETVPIQAAPEAAPAAVKPEAAPAAVKPEETPTKPEEPAIKQEDPPAKPEEAPVKQEDAPVPKPEETAAKPEETPAATVPEADKDVAEMLSDKVPAKVEEVKPEKPAVASSRSARVLVNGNENDIGGSRISDSEQALMQKLNNKCSRRDMSSCVLLKLVTYMNRLLKKSNIEVIEGLHITQTSSEVQVEEETQPRSSGPQDEDSQLSELISNKVWNFVKTRSLKWNVLPDADVVMSTTPDEEGTLNIGMSIRTAKAMEKGRARIKNIGPIIALGAMKFGLLGGLALKALALLVGKALLVSKIALLLAAILWLKKLFSQQKHVTYEVVAHPHHTHSAEHHSGGDSYSSGWGRSSDTENAAHRMAYSAYIPAAASSQ